MKKRINHILAGLLALLGFSSCSALQEAREARAERERQAMEAQQQSLVQEVLAKMKADDERNGYSAERQKTEADLRAAEEARIRAERERAKLLYAVPNVPYRRIEETK